MSSTNRGAKKVPNDKYMTPPYTVASLLDVLDHAVVGQSSFFEPCRGTGAIYDQINASRKGHTELSEGSGYITTPCPSVDLIITNPPFSLALEFLKKSLDHSVSVIYLLRVNFLGSQTRLPFWQAHRPTHLLTLSTRPKFVATCIECKSTAHPGPKRCKRCQGPMRLNSDSTEYAWFCWDYTNVVKLPPGIHVLP